MRKKTRGRKGLRRLTFKQERKIQTIASRLREDLMGLARKLGVPYSDIAKPAARLLRESADQEMERTPGLRARGVGWRPGRDGRGPRVGPLGRTHAETMAELFKERDELLKERAELTRKLYLLEEEEHELLCRQLTGKTLALGRLP